MSCCGGNGRRGDIRGRRVYYVVFNGSGVEVSAHERWKDAIEARDKLGPTAIVRPVKRWPS